MNASSSTVNGPAPATWRLFAPWVASLAVILLLPAVASGSTF